MRSAECKGLGFSRLGLRRFSCFFPSCADVSGLRWAALTPLLRLSFDRQRIRDDCVYSIYIAVVDEGSRFSWFMTPSSSCKLYPDKFYPDREYMAFNQTGNPFYLMK